MRWSWIALAAVLSCAACGREGATPPAPRAIPTAARPSVGGVPKQAVATLMKAGAACKQRLPSLAGRGLYRVSAVLQTGDRGLLRMEVADGSLAAFDTCLVETVAASATALPEPLTPTHLPVAFKL